MLSRGSLSRNPFRATPAQSPTGARATGAQDSGKQQAEAAYASLFPYFAEYCAVSELRKNQGTSVDIVGGGPGGHSLFYLNGVCQLREAGYPELALGRTGSRFMGGKARMQMIDVPMSRLAGMVSGHVRGPVEDMTGLTGKYDLALYWNTSDTMRAAPPVPGAVEVDTSSGPTIFQALKEQLGLVLEKKMGPVKILVVDHFEKVPTAN